MWLSTSFLFLTSLSFSLLLFVFSSFFLSYSSFPISYFFHHFSLLFLLALIFLSPLFSIFSHSCIMISNLQRNAIPTGSAAPFEHPLASASKLLQQLYVLQSTQRFQRGWEGLALQQDPEGQHCPERQSREGQFAKAERLARRHGASQTWCLIHVPPIKAACRERSVPLQCIGVLTPLSAC